MVAAGFGDDVDHRGGRSARLGREAVGGDLKLLHGLLRDVLERTTHDVVVVVGAVDHDVAAAAKLTRGRDRDRVRLGGIEVRGRRVTRHEQRQLEEVAAVERQGVDEAARDHGIDHRTARVDDDRAAHDDRLAHVADRELQVQRHDATDIQNNVLARDVGESCGAGRKIDGARREIRDHEDAVRAGGHRPGHAIALSGDRHLGRGHRRALRIEHAAANRAGCGLSDGAARGDDDRRCAQQRESTQQMHFAPRVVGASRRHNTGPDPSRGARNITRIEMQRH